MRKTMSTLLVAVAVAALAGVAVAHQYAVPTTTTLRYEEDEGRFRGRVSSRRQACEHQRKVKLVRITASGRDVVGSTRTNHSGRWSISEGNANGAYRAVIPRRHETPVGHVHDCQRGTSGTVNVDP